MKSKFAVLVIVLGMSAPMFANGVQIDFTIEGEYRVSGGQDYLDATWVLSIYYDPNTPGIIGSDAQGTFGVYQGAIKNWTVSSPVGYLPPTSILGFSEIRIADDYDGSDAWVAFAESYDDGNLNGYFGLRMESMDDPLTGNGLVLPWSLEDFATTPYAFGEWSGKKGDLFFDSYWEGEITGIQVTMNPVPEPATLSLLAVGLIAGAAFRKRFK